MNTAVMLEKAEQLEKLGMSKAARDLKAKAELARKLALAYEHYRYVTQEKIDAYISRLREATKRRPTEREALSAMGGYNPFISTRALVEQATDVYDTLVLDSLPKYDGIPPTEALEKLGEAQAKEIFDTYEVAHVEPVATQVKLPDPIIFGRVTGCSDRFFIAEWGDDVKLADLIGSNEG